MNAAGRQVPGGLLLSYGCLAASMFIVGACVALSKPLAAWPARFGQGCP